jgi:hypothetical protein
MPRDKENQKTYFKEYYKKNREKILEKNRAFARNGKKKDPFRRLMTGMVARTNRQFHNTFWEKVYGKQYLGCSESEFKSYIESQFQEGMTWENYSHSGWNLDHILPLSKAKTTEDFLKRGHYTNLRPMWAKENYKKGNRIS